MLLFFLLPVLLVVQLLLVFEKKKKKICVKLFSPDCGSVSLYLLPEDFK